MRPKSRLKGTLNMDGLGRSRPGAETSETEPSPVPDLFTSEPVRWEAPLRSLSLTELAPPGKNEYPGQEEKKPIILFFKR